MQRRILLHAGALAGLSAAGGAAWAHHGWSSFDQNRPIYLEGKVVEVKWRNPHVELVLEVPESLTLPVNLELRPVPAQIANIDGAALLGKAVLPTRRDRRWEIELAPLSRINQWKMPEVAVGTELSVVGFTFNGEAGAALVRAEYIFYDGKAYGLRSGPV
jgi:hypothetical protein